MLHNLGASSDPMLSQVCIEQTWPWHRIYFTATETGLSQVHPTRYSSSRDRYKHKKRGEGLGKDICLERRMLGAGRDKKRLLSENR